MTKLCSALSARTVRFALPLLLLATMASQSAFAARCAVMPPEVAAAMGATEAQPETASSPQDETLYAQGTKAMDEQRWADALTAFDRVAAAKGKRADAAMYWKAYSLDKLGRKDEARAACDSLRQSQPNSTWNRECLVLRSLSLVDTKAIAELAQQSAEFASFGNMNWEFEYDGGDAGFRKHATTEDDIKILALNSLMHQDPAKALPMLRSIIHSDKPLAMRKQALFVLSRSKQPEAQAMLTEVARDKSVPELQRVAVETLAIGRGKDAGPTLVEIYRNTSDAQVKRAAVNGLFIAHDATRLVELARAEKDLNLKRDLVSKLSLLKDQVANDYMLELLK